MKKLEEVVDPGNYREIGKFEMTKDVAVYLLALTIPGLIFFLSLIGLLFSLFTGKSELITTINASDDYVKTILQISFLVISTIVFHELIHGAFMSKYGGKLHYGIGIAHWILPFAYATTDATFRRDQFITIALAPLIVISLTGIVFMAAFPDYAQWMFIPLVINSVGAIGDLWMIFILLRMPEHVLVKDNINGLTFYGKPSDDQLNFSSGGLILNFIKGFSAGFVIFLLLDLFYSLFQSLKTDEGFSFSLALSPLLPFSMVAGLIYSVVGSVKKQKTGSEHPSRR